MTTIDSRSPFFVFSMNARARIWTFPRPVRYASRTPSSPYRIPPVGKSGAGMNCISSSVVRSGFRIRARRASITSPMLWGGIEVAIPTAMPELPLTRRVGILAGRTRGSVSDPS